MAEPGFKELIERMRREGDLIRNSGAHSIKSVKDVLNTNSLEVTNRLDELITLTQSMLAGDQAWRDTLEAQRQINEARLEEQRRESSRGSTGGSTSAGFANQDFGALSTAILNAGGRGGSLFGGLAGAGLGAMFANPIFSGGLGIGAAGLGIGGGIGAAALGIGSAIKSITGAMKDFDAEKLKSDFDTIITIGDNFESKENMFTETGAIASSLEGLGKSLITFGAGQGTIAISEWIAGDEKAKWATNLKNNVETLLSIDTKNISKTDEISGTLGALGLGLLAFGFGSTATNIGQTAGSMSEGIREWATGDLSGATWAENVKKNVETLLTINTKSFSETSGISTTLGAIGLGLLLFGLGSTSASVGNATGGMSEGIRDWATGDLSGTTWAENIKDSVETLMGIDPSKFKITTGDFTAGMGEIAFGLVLFALGQTAAAAGNVVSEGSNKVIDKWVKGDLSGKTWAENIKNNVEKLLSIGGGENGLKSSGDFVKQMANIAAGLAIFGGGQVISSLADFSSEILNAGINWFTGQENNSSSDKVKDKVESLLAIGTEENVKKSENFKTAMANIATALTEFSGEKLTQSLNNLGTSFLNLFSSDKEDPFDRFIKLGEQADNLSKVPTSIDLITESIKSFIDVMNSLNDVSSSGMAKGFRAIENLMPKINRLITGEGTGGEDFLGFGEQSDTWERARRNLETVERIIALNNIANLEQGQKVAEGTAAAATQSNLGVSLNTGGNVIRGGDVTTVNNISSGGGGGIPAGTGDATINGVFNRLLQ